MNVVKEVAKTEAEAKKLVLTKLNANESEVVLSFAEVKSGGLFKSTNYECTGFLKTEIVDGVTEYLKQVINGMDLEVSFEVSKKTEATTIKIYSSNNGILIGKDGRNLDALTTLARAYVSNLTSNGPKIILDVEDYKEKQIKRIERLAKNIARDVLRSKVDVEMDNMNSYERRAVHNILSTYKNIKTESVGEEPNRHVVIKYVENKED